MIKSFGMLISCTNFLLECIVSEQGSHDISQETCSANFRNLFLYNANIFGLGF